MANVLQALNVRVYGKGPNTLILAHGVGSDKFVWRDIVRLFRQEELCKVVVFDLACSGNADQCWYDSRRHRHGSTDGYVDDLLQIIEALQIQRCAYVGHAFSAMIGLLASIRRPELFSKLFLINACPRFMTDVNYYTGFSQRTISRALYLMEMNYRAWVDWYAPIAIGETFPDHMVEYLKTRLLSMIPSRCLAASRLIYWSDFRPILSLVTVPCCLITAENDHTVPPFMAEYLALYMIRSPTTVVALSTGSHMPHFTRPSLFYWTLRAQLLR